MLFSPRNLISIDDLTREDIALLYRVTIEFMKILERPNKKVPALKDLTIANLFFEDSTRTRISFELAQKRLSADIINFSSGSSSLKKGETILDTVRNLLAMKIDLIIVRDKHSGTPHFLAKQTNIPVINAGDGTNEHPTQALLDLFTLWAKGLNASNSYITLTGDLLHSRVAGSNIKLWEKVGFSYELTGPNTVLRNTWRPETTRAKFPNHIIYHLRIQKERMNMELIPSQEEYNRYFGARQKDFNENTFFMHPGPINRGVEMDSEVADSPQSLILQQVEMGVALRMAIIFLLGQKKGG